MLRNQFLQNGNESGRYLIEQLRLLNADEWKHVSGPDDVMGGMEYQFKAGMEQHINGFLKIHIANILSDLYPQLSPELQTAALETLAESFTPSTHETQTAGSIGWAFYRIGSPSVPYLLGMLSNPSKFVRCFARQQLNGFVPDSTQKENGLPPLACEDPIGGDSVAKSRWLEWWKEKGTQIHLKDLPSFVDFVSKPPVKPAR